MSLKLKILMAAIAMFEMASQSALLVSTLNIVSSGTGTNGSVKVMGSINSVANSQSSGGGFVVRQVQQAVLIGIPVIPTLPTITTQPTNSSVLAGQPFTFFAPFVGTPPLSYQWVLNGTNLLGKTNSVLTVTNASAFNTGNYSVIVSSPFGTATGVVATVSIAGIFSPSKYTAKLNPLTGLYEEQVTITNNGAAISGIQMVVSNLPSRVSLYNAAGTNNGLPYAQFNVTMTNGAASTFLLQFYNPYRLNFTNTVQVYAVAAIQPTANSAVGVPISRIYIDNSVANSPRFTFAFTSVANKNYEVFYSDDLVNWTLASTLTASSTWTIWTEMMPAGNNRYFKVLQLP
jgi:hypothetical protein